MGFEDRSFKAAEQLTRKGAGVLTWMRAGTVAVAADALVIPTTHAYVAKTTGSDAEALTLANGSPGQEIVINITVDGGGTGTLTPATATGWATIVMADAGDSVTVRYINSTIGWLLVGTKGIAAPPVTT